MAHCISGIVTSFPYNGEHARLVMVGPFHFLPIDLRKEKQYWEESVPPYRAYSAATRKRIRELSFKGKCAYIETDFFVEGTQFAEVWDQGKRILGPVFSLHGYSGGRLQKLEQRFADFERVEEAINLALRLMGVFQHEGKDEFDSVRLGEFRKNEDIAVEIEDQKEASQRAPE